MSRSRAEYMTKLEQARATNAVRMAEIMHNAMEEDRPSDAAEQEEFDELQQDCKAIDEDLKRLRLLAEMKPEDKPASPNGKDEAAAPHARPYLRVHPPGPSLT